MLQICWECANQTSSRTKLFQCYTQCGWIECVRACISICLHASVQIILLICFCQPFHFVNSKLPEEGILLALASASASASAQTQTFCTLFILTSFYEIAYKIYSTLSTPNLDRSFTQKAVVRSQIKKKSESTPKQSQFWMNSLSADLRNLVEIFFKILKVKGFYFWSE